MNSLKKLIKSSSRKGESDNPFLTARRSWNDRTDAISYSRKMWMAIAILGAMTTLTSVGGMIHFASGAKYIPYVVEVDRLGKAVASGPLQSTFKADPRIFKARVAEFIADARLVTPDVALQRAAIFRVYSRLSPSDPAIKKMNEWLNGSKTQSPFQRAKTEMVSTEIKSIMPQTPDTWQVDWIETIRDRSGGSVRKPITYRALVTVYQAEPSEDTKEKELIMNPLGIFIKDYSWQKLL